MSCTVTNDRRANKRDGWCRRKRVENTSTSNTEHAPRHLAPARGALPLSVPNNGLFPHATQKLQLAAVLTAVGRHQTIKRTEHPHRQQHTSFRQEQTKRPCILRGRANRVAHGKQHCTSLSPQPCPVVIGPIQQCISVFQGILSPRGSAPLYIVSTLAKRKDPTSFTKQHQTCRSHASYYKRCTRVKEPTKRGRISTPGW